MYRILLLFLVLFTQFVALAQNRTISGRVLDEDTGEGIPFCNVYLKGTTIGVSTDIDGFYSLSSISIADTIIASALNYNNGEKPLSSEAIQTINFRLKSADYSLSEVVVFAGENPANAIVRNIIKYKKQNRIEALDAYQCEEYKKVELDLVDFSEKLQKRKLLKPFDFVFENIDSTSDEKPFLPAYITESVSRVHYLKSEGKAIVIPEAQKSSGIDNKTVVELINSMHDEFSVYDNWIELLEKPFASPFAKQALFNYEFYIMDSTLIEGQWSYKLKFKPKRKQENTFYGDFWVADNSFAIQRVNMRISPDANINLIDRIIIFQDFDYHKSGRWLPAKQKMILDFKTLEKGPGMIGRKTVSYRQYLLNAEQLPKELPKFDREYYTFEELIQDDNYWKNNRHDSLSKNEAAIYTVIDSIQKVPIYQTYADIVWMLMTGYLELGKVELGPISTIYNQNPVEGHRFRMGAWTSNNFSDRVRFGGYLAYGLKDKAFKYSADFQYNISKSPRIIIGGAYKKDISFSNQNSEEIGGGNIFSGFYRRPILQKLINIEEGKVFYERFWKKGWSNKLTLLHQRMDPYGKIKADGAGFNYAYLPSPESPNIIDTTVSTTEFIFKTRYANGERFVEGEFFRTSLGSKFPIIELQYTLGLKGVLNGEYSYHKIALSYRHYVNVAPFGWLGYRLKLGKVFGQVPFLLAEVHPGNESYFYDNYIYNGMNNYEFASDSYISLMLVHHFDGFLLNKIPLFRKLKLRSVVSYRTVYGTMSEKNREANQLNRFDPEIVNSYSGFQVPNNKPYMEASIGIENIFKIIRLDALWRLNYLNNPEAKRFTYRAGLQFFF